MANELKRTVVWKNLLLDGRDYSRDGDDFARSNGPRADQARMSLLTFVDGELLPKCQILQNQSAVTF